VHKIELNLENSRSDRQRTSHFALTRLAYSPTEGAQVIKLGSRTLVLHSELVRFLGSLGARGRRGRPPTAQPEAMA